MNNETLKKKLFLEIRTFLEKNFLEHSCFVCVYGSFATGHRTDASDLDIFVAVKDAPVGSQFERLNEFIISLHKKYNLNIDYEVPYENKLIVSYDDVEHAVALRAFKKEDKKYHIPTIIKTRESLLSPEIRWRLLLNALTSPHECIYGNKRQYFIYKSKAEKSLIELAKSISDFYECDNEKLLNALMCGKNGEDGELYLGYKRDRLSVVLYLKDLIRKYK